MQKKIENNFSSLVNVELVHSGDDYFQRLLNIISNAQTEIHLQTYIFESDEIGQKIANTLIEVAKKNVQIFVLLDAYGSRNLSSTFLNNLSENGINVRLFSPFFSMNNFYIGRRLHQKVIVADGNTALIGGINIADKYRGSLSEIPWLDFAVQIKDEAICKPLQELCSNIYFKKSKLKSQPLFTNKDASVKILQNDWLKRKNEISNAYTRTFQKATNEIIIVASYFLPSKRLRNVLKIASRKKVKIKIVLSSLSDLPIALWATKYLYNSFLKQGIELYEWKKSVLHGKLAIVDGNWTTIGSFNLNHLSSFGSIEMNVAINSNLFTEKVSLKLNDIITQCNKITFETLEKRNGIFRRFRNFIAYYFVRIVLIIGTYIPRKGFFKFY